MASGAEQVQRRGLHSNPRRKACLRLAGAPAARDVGHPAENPVRRRGFAVRPDQRHRGCETGCPMPTFIPLLALACLFLAPVRAASSSSPSASSRDCRANETGRRRRHARPPDASVRRRQDRADVRRRAGDARRRQAARRVTTGRRSAATGSGRRAPRSTSTSSCPCSTRRRRRRAWDSRAARSAFTVRRAAGDVRRAGDRWSRRTGRPAASRSRPTRHRGGRGLDSQAGVKDVRLEV